MKHQNHSTVYELVEGIHNPYLLTPEGTCHAMSVKKQTQLHRKCIYFLVISSYHTHISYRKGYV